VDTTFTYKGALASLDWGPVLERLVKKTRRGGLLHISGYFRTGLHEELSWSLSQLSPNLIVCIDHGKFEPEDNRAAASALLTAFAERAIDIYICTFFELQGLMALVGLEVDKRTAVDDALKFYHERTELPRVTVVRCEPSGEEANAYVMIDGDVVPVTSHTGRTRYTNEPGVSNAFNAGFAYNLCEGDPSLTLNKVVVGAVEAGLETWKKNQ
jgi:hypothetical protein